MQYPTDDSKGDSLVAEEVIMLRAYSIQASSPSGLVQRGYAV